MTRAAERAVGRPRLAKFARLVTNEVRLDTPNEIDLNGEVIVQRLARTVDKPVVFDVGSHFGEWSESLLRQPGAAPVIHAFEPSAYSRAMAVDALGDAATVHQLALSAEPGAAELVIVHEGAGSNSLVEFTDKNRAYEPGLTETVTLSTVSDIARAEGIDRITLLKIDAEGHDLAVIQGARDLTDRHGIDMIQFEYNLRWIDSRRFLLDAFEELQPRGYRMGKITRLGIEVYPEWHHELEHFVEGNYLAWLPEWEPKMPTIAWWGG